MKHTVDIDNNNNSSFFGSSQFFFILISDENEKSDELEDNIEEDNCNVNYENYEDSLPGSNDIALWPSNLSDRKIDYLVKFIPHSVGDISSLKIEYTDRNRTYMRNFHTSDFYCTKANGKKEKREWLIYSETSRKIYCFVRKLFSKSSNKLITGYNSWKNISRDLKDHECSKEHTYIFYMSLQNTFISYWASRQQSCRKM